MFILSNLIGAVAEILNLVLTIFYWLIIIRALISWVNPDPYNSIVQFLHKVTEPVLAPIRKFLPFQYNIGIDLSPIIVFFLIIFVKRFFVTTLIDIAYRLR
ncbi:MAG: YggT family protein [Candidatus Omnitrophica bacterium]|jgi:YggT family protein|nr:YggT family protein [Candidatus Omnitrophota bacterium]MDD5440971.1 YggT family protein [Candidatus Omnitrophota bacterium]